MLLWGLLAATGGLGAQTAAPEHTWELRFVGPDGQPASGVEVHLDRAEDRYRTHLRALARAGLPRAIEAMEALGTEGELAPLGRASRGETDGEGWVRLGVDAVGLYRTRVETGDRIALPRLWGAVTSTVGPEQHLATLEEGSVRLLDGSGAPASRVWWTRVGEVEAPFPPLVDGSGALAEPFRVRGEIDHLPLAPWPPGYRPVPASGPLPAPVHGRGHGVQAGPLLLLSADGEPRGSVQGETGPGRGPGAGSSPSRGQRVTTPLSRPVRVVDPSGQPVPFPLALDETGTVARAVGDSQGRLLLPAVDGEIPVEVLGPDGLSLRAVLPAPPAGPDGRPLAGEAAGAALRDEDSARGGPPVWQLEAPARITGRVRDSGGDPIPDALVVARSTTGWVWEEALGWAVTDGAGRFALRVPAGEAAAVALQLAAAGFTSEVEVVEAPATALELTLEPVAQLAGTVVDESGGPVPGAQVGLRPIDPEDHRRGAGFHGGESGPDGSFRLGGMVAGVAYVLSVEAPGFVSRSRELEPFELRERRGGLEIVLESTLRGVGRVLDGAGAPIVGARVHPMEDGGELMALGLLFARRVVSRLDGGALTDGEGVFELLDLEAGALALYVEADGFTPAAVRGIEIPAAAADPEADKVVDLGTLYLDPEAVVEGRVVDDAGQPVPGAQVMVAESGPFSAILAAALGSGGTEADAVSDEDGRFRLGGLAEGWTLDLAAGKEGWLPGSLKAVTVPPEEEPELVLGRGATLEGVVVDQSGLPVEDVRVAVVRGDGVSLRDLVGSFDSVRTDAEGRFTLETVTPGRVDLEASSPDAPKARVRGLEVAPGEVLEGIRIVLEAGVRVTGRVVDETGSALPAAMVMLRGSTSRSAFSDEDGTFELDGVPPGTRTLVARRSGYLETTQELEVTPLGGPGANTVELRLERGLSVSGRVVWEDGRPLDGATVGLGSDEGPRASGGVARTGEDGSFTVEGVANGVYRLRVSSSSAPGTVHPEPVVVSGEPVTGLRVVVSEGIAVSGVVTGLDQDRLVRVIVMAQREASSQEMRSLEGEGQVAFDGSYRLEGLTPGTWVLRALEGFSGRQASARVELRPGDLEVEVDLEFGTGYRLDGEVLLDGEPLVGASVLLSEPGNDPDRLSGVAGLATTDGRGRFTFEGIEAGSWSVVLYEESGGLSGEVAVEIPRDDEVRMELESLRVTGRVVDVETGLPVVGARVSMGSPGPRRSRGSLFQVETDDQGAFELRGTGGGARGAAPQEVRAEADGYGASVETVTPVPGGGAAVVEIALVPTPGAVLVVRRSDGARVLGVVLAAQEEGRGGQLRALGERRADSDGRVRLADLAPGSYRLRVRASGTATVEVPVTVGAGTSSPVPVALPPEAAVEVVVPDLMEGPGASLALVDGRGRPFWIVDRTRAVTELPLVRGRARVGGLPPGSWTVRVVATTGEVWEEPLVLSPGERRTVTPRSVGVVSGDPP